MTARVNRGIAWGLFLLASAAGTTSANADEAAERTVHVGSAADVLAIADEASRTGDVEAAEVALRALFDDPAPPVRAEARFRLAKMIAAAGRISEAAVLLRRILDDHPRATPPRLELAVLLNKLGHQDLALRELRSIRTADVPPAVARFVDRISASLQASKPFGVHVEFALAPDSNINRATRSDTLGTVFGDFTFDEDARRKSGVGAALRGQAHRRLTLNRDISVVARASTDLNLYRDKRFNDISSELSVGPEFRLSKTRFTADVGVGRRWYGMQPYQRQLRVSGSASRALGAVSQGRIDASLRWSDNRVNDLQDGRGLTLRARYERALSPQMSLSANVTADRFKARDDAYSTRAWTAGLTAYRDVGRTSFSLGAEIGRLKADERLELLPQVRKDKLARLSFGAVFRHFTVVGFAPMTRIVVERNRSNVEFYDYKRTRTEFGISRAF